MAGDVTARIDQGRLIIKGDSLDNGITIAAGTIAGMVVVTGVNQGGIATHVNGMANGAATLTGFTGGLKIKMKDGKDTVSITGLTVAGKADVDGGDGNDQFTLSGTTFHQSLDVRLDKGSDTLSLTNTKVAGKAKLEGNRGDDNMTIASSMFGKLTTKLGRDNDSLNISGTTVSEKTKLKGGPGANAFTNGTGNSLAALRAKHFNNGTTNSTSPTLSISGAASVNEGALYTLTLSASGMGASTISRWNINWGDGTANQVVTGNPTSVTHTFAEGPATRTISATATNPNGTFNAGNTVALTVNNLAPSVALNTVSPITENNSATLTGSYTDLGVSDIHTVTVNWGDPNNGTHSTFTVPATNILSVNHTINSTSADGAVLTITAINAATGQVGFSVQHRYLDDGVAPGNSTTSDTNTITVTVADDDLGTGNATRTVLVNNVAPQISDPADTSVNEHSEVTLTATITDPGTRDVFSVDVDWKDGGPVTIPGLGLTNVASTIIGGTTYTWTAATRQLTLKHTYLDDAPTATASDVKAVTLIPHDDDTGTGATKTVNVTVKNVAPIVALNAVADINANDTVTLTGSFTDIGLLDVHRLTAIWGDGTSHSMFSIPATNALGVGNMFNSSQDSAVLTITSVNVTTGQVGFSVQHRYTAISTGSLSLSVDDDDTGIDTKSVSFVVHA
jgi:hypothetical protein